MLTVAATTLSNLQVGFNMSVFTSKGLIGKQYCGYELQKWCLFQHNTHKILKVYDSFEDCIGDVYPEKLTYTRGPTSFELGQGYGATHCLEFDTLDCVRPDGGIKRWIKDPVTGKRCTRG